MGRFGAILILLLLTPLLLALILVGWILVPGLWLLERIALRIHCWRTGKWVLLVCSRDHSWNEFVLNNVAPALPAGIELVWHEELSKRALWSGFGQIQRCGSGQPKPYLVRVTRFRIRCRSIHQALLPFKFRAARDERVAMKIHGILAAEACRAA